MSSYKAHSIFAIILGLLFFQNPLLVALTFIGGNIPDNDHNLKQDNVYKMIIAGLLVFISLYIMKLPYYLGILICLLGIVFYFSSHRGFTHSILGLTVLSLISFLIVIIGVNLLNSILNLPKTYSSNLSLIFMAMFLSLFFVNTKLIMPFFIALILIFLYMPMNIISTCSILTAIFLGILSHLILDSFTDYGLKLFYPFSKRKVYKKFGISLLVILFIISFIACRGLLYNIIIYNVYYDYIENLSYFKLTS